ncbi:MAG: methyltransferase domain-containing protein [Candidatus Scalindua sp.]
MKERLIQFLVCPECSEELELSSPCRIDCNGEIREGQIECKLCRSKFPIRNYIPRFVSSTNYTSSFGFQWNKHARTQIDSFNGLTLSHDRFYKETNWEEKLDSEIILEAGCGAGRFTSIALKTGAEVFSFDYSNAVDACLENNGLANNLHVIQADIYHIPLKKNLFDKIFCFGVLQHCPDTKEAFLSLVPHMKSGGELVIDVYGKSTRWKLWRMKYKIRPLTTKLNYRFLYNILRISIPLILPLKIWLSKCTNRTLSKVGEAIPVLNYMGIYPLSRRQLLDWSILDTFDMLSAKYDNPQTIEAVEEWFANAGLVKYQVGYGPNGINAMGRKR